MRSVPSRLVACVVGVAALALFALAMAIVRSPRSPDGVIALRSGLLASLVLAARLFPLQAGPKTKTTLATAPLFAAALLLPAPLGILIGGASALIGEALRRVPWLQAAFNASEAMLRVAAGAAVVALVSGGRGLAGQPLEVWMLAVPCAALTMYAVNVTAVEFIVGVQMRRFPLPGFGQRRRADMPLEASLFGLGLIIAFLTGVSFWLIPLLGAGLALAYRIQQRRSLSPGVQRSPGGA